MIASDNKLHLDSNSVKKLLNSIEGQGRLIKSRFWLRSDRCSDHLKVFMGRSRVVSNEYRLGVIIRVECLIGPRLFEICHVNIRRSNASGSEDQSGNI
jgi:hypothetical protein